MLLKLISLPVFCRKDRACTAVAKKGVWRRQGSKEARFYKPCAEGKLHRSSFPIDGTELKGYLIRGESEMLN